MARSVKQSRSNVVLQKLVTETSGFIQKAEASLGPEPLALTALEKRHAHERFQRLDLAAHRRLREEQLRRGPREAQMPRRGFESPQQVEGRQGPGGRTHLVSPVVAAATAIAGHFALPEDL